MPRLAGPMVSPASAAAMFGRAAGGAGRRAGLVGDHRLGPGRCRRRAAPRWRASAGAAPYGKLCPSCRVSTASGSFCAAERAATPGRPRSVPYLARAAIRTSADCISVPPPPPNSPPTTPAIAIRSVIGERLRAARVGDRVQVPGEHVLAGAVAVRHAGADVGVDPGDVARARRRRAARPAGRAGAARRPGPAGPPRCTASCARRSAPAPGCPARRRRTGSACPGRRAAAGPW